MSMAKVEKTKDSLVITVPLKGERWCPFTEESKGEMDNVIGLIDEGLDDMGFCYRIDMSYKGKDDQWTDFFFKWFGEKKEFIELCKRLKIDLIVKEAERKK